MKLYCRNTMIVILHLIVMLIVVEVKGQHCPRNQDRDGQECVTQCVTNSDCRNANKQCLCDGDCGKGCINPRAPGYCQTTGQPDNGRRWYSSSNRLFNTTITYECNRGYILLGMATRRCQGYRTWSGTAPECEPGTTCSRPDVGEKILLSDNKQLYVEGDLLDISCDFGYYVRGPSRFMCQAGGQWSSSVTDITCYPKSCRDPGRIDHGSRSSEVITFGAQMIYTCDEGYTLVGRAWMVCGADTEWSSSTPRCRPVECPMLNVPENGDFFPSTRTFNTRVEITCNDGFEVAGRDGHLRSVTRTCLADQSWSGAEVVCQDVDCGDLGYLPNGHKESLSGGQTTYDSIFYLKCDEGTKRDGSDTTTCRADGRWTNPLPNCWERCVIPELTNGRRNYPHRWSQSIDHEASFGFSCSPAWQYQKSGSEDVSCFNGTLSYIPRCDPNPCSITIPSSSGTSYLSDETPLDVGRHSIQHGRHLRIVCQDGYRLKGYDDDIVCDRSTMSGSISWCVERSCTVPTVTGVDQISKDYGRTRYRPGDEVESNVEITMTCDISRYRGENTARCVRGDWVPDPTTVTVCQPRKCQLPQVHDGTTYNTAGPSVEHAGHLSIWCNAGYIKDSTPDTVVCQYGSWLNRDTPLQKDSLVCKPEPCVIPYIINGHIVRINQQNVTIPEGGSIETNDQVKLLCSDGYEITAFPLGTIQKTLQCEYGSLDDIPECNREASCPKSSDIPGTTYTYDQHSVSQRAEHDTRAIVTCDPYYDIYDDNSSVKCYQGRWKTDTLRSFTTLPACSRSGCPVPNIPNGFVVSSPDDLTGLQPLVTIIPYRETVWQKCLPLFNLHNGKTQHRLNCGNGFEGLANCIPQKCVISASNHGTKYLHNKVELHLNETIANGEEITMKCLPFFIYLGKKKTKLTCQRQKWFANGEEYSDIPRCVQDTRCQKLPPDAGYNRTTYIPNSDRAKVDELTNVTVECLNGREPSVEVATCRSGRWEPDIPECLYCTVPEPPVVMWISRPRGRVEAGNIIRNNGAVVSLCDDGYRSVDTQVDEIRSYCLNGTWNPTITCEPVQSQDNISDTSSADREVGNPSSNVDTLSAEREGGDPSSNVDTLSAEREGGDPSSNVVQYQDSTSDMSSADRERGDRPSSNVGCPLPHIDNGRVVGLPQLEPGSSIHKHGDRGLAECVSEYRFHDDKSQKLIVCSNSSWYPTDLHCHRICRVSHPLPSNVIPFYDNNTQLLPPATIIEGRTLILECENDNSHVSWMCTSNGWSNRMLPDCNAVIREPCITPYLPSTNMELYLGNGTKIREQEEVPIGERIEIICLNGWNSNWFVSWECTTEGWSPDRFPDCSPGCTKPSLAVHTVFSTNKAIYDEHEVITVSCEPGFVLIGGDPRIQCESNGSWNISRYIRHRCEPLDISIEEISPLAGYRRIRVTCTVSSTFRSWPVYITYDGSYIVLTDGVPYSTTTVYSRWFYYRESVNYQCVANYGRRPVLSRTFTT